MHDSTNSALVIPTAATDAPAAHDTEQEPMSSLVKRVTEVAEEKALAATQVPIIWLEQQHHPAALMRSSPT